MKVTISSSVMAVLALAFPAIMRGSPIIVPQNSPCADDANTILLEHFEGSNVGSANGSVGYTTGVFDQGVHVVDTAWIAYNIGALTQGTVEF